MSEKLTGGAPILWFGGKGRFVGKLKALVPHLTTYVESFGGAASLLFAREPDSVEVYNDLSGDLVCLFRALQDEECFEKLRRRMEATLYSFDEFRLALRTLENPLAGEDDRAWAMFVAQNQSIGGRAASPGNWGRALSTTIRGMARVCASWESKIGSLPRYHARLARVQIDARDALEVVAYWDTPETVQYLDPPYVLHTRRGGKVYRVEATDVLHRRLVRLILKCRSAFVLSGYASEIYAPLEEAGWERLDFAAVVSAAGRVRGSRLRGAGALTREVPSIETIWRNLKAVELAPVTDEWLEKRRGERVTCATR